MLDAETDFNLANGYINSMGLSYYSNGSMYGVAGNIMLYPSRDLYEKYPLDAKKAWGEWQEEQKPKTPKTWSELLNSDYYEWSTPLRELCMTTKPIEKSALALLKIHQLIEVGYGGTVTYERCASMCYDNVFKIAPCGIGSHLTFYVKEVEGEGEMNHIVFHTREQAEEFLSYPENIQLLKDYFMI